MAVCHLQIEEAQGGEDEEARNALQQLKSQTAVLSSLSHPSTSKAELSEQDIAQQLAA
jgi:hypothetical protein